MIGKTISHYEIIAKIGEGGMGVVYKATDTKLHRTVALKFLPARLTDDTATKKRFLREARSASAVQHSNVCTIHEIGETDDGQMYICMEHYDGKTLDRLMADGEITVESALDIVIQVADGLAKAHKTGITHRDIKPSNILVTADGIPKLLDFGLAKLGADTKVTKTGTTLGTMAYMAPEQVKGEEADASSDVWSLGVVLYELLTGALPFPGEHSAAMMYGILNLDPPPITNYWSSAPAELQSIISSTLQKNPGDRIESAAALAQALIDVEARLPGSPKRRHLPGSKPRGAQPALRNKLIGIAASVVLLASLSALIIPRVTTQAPPETLALAVMDFVNLSDPANNVQSSGMAGLLHVGFVQNITARVVSPDYLRDVGRRLFGTETGPVADSQVLQVAKESGADLMLAGQLGTADERQYVVWRLVDIRTGESLGAKRVDGGDPLVLADDIVAEVARILEHDFGLDRSTESRSVGELTTKNPAAHELFVTGVLAAKQYRTTEAVEHFKEATALDPTFALAYLEMARSQWQYSYVDSRESAEKAWDLRTHLSIKDRMRLEAFRLQLNYKVEAATDTYRELAARWPDDYSIRTDLFAQLYTWFSFPEALEVAQRNIALFPDDAYFASFMSQVLAQLGRPEAALTAERDLVRSFPDSHGAWYRLGLRFLEVGLPDSAQVWFGRRLAEIPDNLNLQLNLDVVVPYCRGDLAGAMNTCERLLESEDLTADQANMVRDRLKALCYEGGKYNKALALFDEESPKNRIDAFYAERLRVAYLLKMGKAREALQWSEAVAETLRIHAEEAEDPQYLQYMGIARWTARDHRASALAQLDSLDAAEAAAKELLASGQEFGGYALRSALMVKLRIAIKRQDAKEAGALVERLEAVGGHVSTWYNRLAELKAEACRLQGKYEEAERVLEENVRIYGGNARGHYNLARLYEAMDRPTDAAKSYARFLELWANADEGLPELADARTRLTVLGGQY